MGSTTEIGALFHQSAGSSVHPYTIRVVAGSRPRRCSREIRILPDRATSVGDASVDPAAIASRTSAGNCSGKSDETS